MTLKGSATNDLDHYYIKLAIQQAQQAALIGEVPVGALVVHGGNVIASSYNLRESTYDPVAHAEILALRLASQTLKRWRLTGCTLYVTLEPCAMCAGALVNARVDRLVYGASDTRAGAVRSLYEIVTDQRLNHRLDVTADVCAEECAQLLKDFFASRRHK